MININGINTTSNISFSQKPSQKVQYNKPNYQMYSYLKDEKITVGEGTELLLYGILTQGKELLSSILEHPLKTAALIGGTTLGLMALPFIGIPTAVGGGILAAGFAAISLGKTAIHTAEFVKHNKKGSYDIARLSLEQLGKDTFDSALTLPFVPKAITNIKSFSKFGKINLNSELISQLKNTKKFSEKLSTLKAVDKELSRNLNFQYAVEKELSQLKNLTKYEKDIIRKELLDFNISTNNIPEIVIDKWAQAKGIFTKPDIKYAPFPKNTNAMANASDCSITINDYSQNIPNVFNNLKVTSIKSISNNEYLVTTKNNKTGAIITETIEKEILDTYNQLSNIYKNLSSEAKNILVIIHEREHIHQFASMCRIKGFDWLKHSITERGRNLLNQMTAEMEKKNILSSDYLRIFSYFNNHKLETQISYIKKPIEIDARAAEFKAINNFTFNMLNKVFTRTNKAQTMSIEKNILLNTTRIESPA
jgi:hypothetical protein